MIDAHPELAVGAVIVVLYLLDLVTLVHFNEVFLEVAGTRRATHVSGSRVEIANRRLALLNPVTPHVLLFRIRWGARSWRERRTEQDVRRVHDGARALHAPRMLGVLLAVTLFAFYPVLCLLVGFAPAFVATAITGYALVLTAGVLVTARRARLGIALEKLLPLLAASVLCLPCGINLARRASLLIDIPSDAAKLLPDLVPALTWDVAAAAIVARAREELELGLDELTENRLRAYLDAAFPR